LQVLGVNMWIVAEKIHFIVTKISCCFHFILYQETIGSYWLISKLVLVD
jgi:hypothetical protein